MKKFLKYSRNIIAGIYIFICSFFIMNNMVFALTKVVDCTYIDPSIYWNDEDKMKNYCNQHYNEHGKICEIKGKPNITTHNCTTSSNSIYANASRDAYYKCNGRCEYKKVNDSLRTCETKAYMNDSCGSKNGNTCGQNNYGVWSKSSCNATVTAGKYHIWNGTDNCCSITNLQTNSIPKNVGKINLYDDSTACKNNGNYYYNGVCYALDEANCNHFGFYWDGSKCDSTSNSINITFDESFGYGLTCESPIGKMNVGDGVNTCSTCTGTIKSGSVFKFPSSSSNMIKQNYGSLLGWTKSVENGVPICATYGGGNSTIINSDTELTESQNTYYYACYEDFINGARYAQDGASADGQEVSCGTLLNITKCYVNNGQQLCNYNKYGDSEKNGVVYRNKISSGPSVSYCSSIIDNSSCQESIIDDDRYAQVNAYVSGDSIKCGDRLHITKCNCNDDSICEFDSINGSSANGTVYRKYLNLKDNSSSCSKSDSCTNEVQKNITASTIVNVCNGKNYNDLVKCANGYSIDKSQSIKLAKCDGEDCDTYKIVCSSGSSSKPVVEASSVNVSSDGYGYIDVTAKSSSGSIVAFYVSQNISIPTDSSDWKNSPESSMRLKGQPGTYYIWAKDSNNNISNTFRVSIIDTVNTSTTVEKLELYDANGKVQTPSSVSYNSNGISSSDYVRLSNKLVEKSKLANVAFNPFTTEYKVTVDSPTLSVYATLTSKDSKYIDGYEPRTVNLTYGVNTVLIKIEDNTGKVRTYTIIVTRNDDRTSDNTLSDLKVDKGDLEFNSNVTDYKVSVPKDSVSVKVDSTIGSSLASYVSGYEPGEVELTENVTSKLIKIKSQTGSTRTYVITFIKDGSDIVKDKSLMLYSLSIPGVYIPFEKEVLNYSSSVGYEIENINLYPVLNDESSSYIISKKNKEDNKYSVVSSYGIPLNIGENFIEVKVINSLNQEAVYRLTIIRKEFGLDVSKDTTLKELNVLGHNIKFVPSRKEYKVKIKTEKTLIITAVPNSNRAEVFIRGNEELTGFSTVRVKVIAENGDFDIYSIDIKKDIFNKTLERLSILVGAVIILGTSCILIIKKKRKQKQEYLEE